MCDILEQKFYVTVLAYLQSVEQFDQYTHPFWTLHLSIIRDCVYIRFHHQNNTNWFRHWGSPGFSRGRWLRLHITISYVTMEF